MSTRGACGSALAQGVPSLAKQDGHQNTMEKCSRQSWSVMGLAAAKLIMAGAILHLPPTTCPLPISTA